MPCHPRCMGRPLGLIETSLPPSLSLFIRGGFTQAHACCCSHRQMRRGGIYMLRRLCLAMHRLILSRPTRAALVERACVHASRHDAHAGLLTCNRPRSIIE